MKAGRGEQMSTTSQGSGRRTHRDARVLVQDDLQQVWREDGRGLEPLFRFRDVRLLMVGSWWGAGQLCREMVTRMLRPKLIYGFLIQLSVLAPSIQTPIFFKREEEQRG